jgi:hypothetical protein
MMIGTVGISSQMINVENAVLDIIGPWGGRWQAGHRPSKLVRIKAEHRGGAEDRGKMAWR